MSRNVLLVELDGMGHRFYHIRLLAQEALAEGAKVTVLTRDDAGSRAHLDVHLAQVRDCIQILEVAVPSWFEVVRTARQVAADITVVPEADGWLIPLLRGAGWSGPGRLSLQVMRTRAVHVGRSRVHWAAVHVAKVLAITATMFLPRVDVRVLRSPLWGGHSFWPPSLDPVGLVGTSADVEKLRHDWQLDGDRYWFAVLGAVTPNKNLPLVAEALSRFDPVSPCGLLVAGVMTDEVAADLPRLLELLKAADIPVRVVDRLLDDVELDSALRAVDCLVLAYDHNGPSGTFVKAVAAGTRVVAAGSPALRDDCAAVPASASWCAMAVKPLTLQLNIAMQSPRPEPVELPGESSFARTLLG